MEEERRAIKNYEKQYEITRTGRIIIKRNNQVRHRNGDDYGYANVHLHKNGKRMLYKTFDLWKETFPEVDESEYKGLK